MVRYITKRDGRVVEFDSTKIEKAILSAMKSVKDVNIGIAVKIANSIKNLEQEALGIEKIQDLVEDGLMNNGCNKVAKEYITYRAERSKTRRLKTEINQKVISILSGCNIQNNNANVDEHSFGGRKNESASVIQKELALDLLIDPEVSKAFREFELYIHDMSEYYIGSHNCLFVMLDSLLKNGFMLRNGDIRPANSLSTACQLTAVVFQIQS